MVIGDGRREVVPSPQAKGEGRGEGELRVQLHGLGFSGVVVAQRGT